MCMLNSKNTENLKGDFNYIWKLYAQATVPVSSDHIHIYLNWQTLGAQKLRRPGFMHNYIVFLR